MNTLYLSDNLPILQSIPSETVDLIYTDPPFNSNRNYSGMIKSPSLKKVATELTEDVVNQSSKLNHSEQNNIPRAYSSPPLKGDFGINSKNLGTESTSNSLILAQFEDTWRGGMKVYIHEFMFPIVKELHIILLKKLKRILCRFIQTIYQL